MQLLAERDSDGTTYEYVYGASVPLELVVTPGPGLTGAGIAKRYAYQTGAGGSVIGITDASGAEIARYAYDPYGNPAATSGTDPLAARNPLRYRGYYWDAETGLYYLPARYYEPRSARFLSVDPAAPSAGDPATINRYAYCAGDPVGASDPTGAVMDGDGNGKADSWDNAWESSVHSTNLHARDHFRARASGDRDHALTVSSPFRTSTHNGVRDLFPGGASYELTAWLQQVNNWARSPAVHPDRVIGYAYTEDQRNWGFVGYSKYTNYAVRADGGEERIGTLEGRSFSLEFLKIPGSVSHTRGRGTVVPGAYHSATIGCVLGVSGWSSWGDNSEGTQWGVVTPSASITPFTVVR